ncbi:hypothetical protein [Flavobacterium sp. BFFFF1]|uniref:hypothetical protein n=1 Tax=Flavobacterium sp. BFFFF1 TaxID=2015557 RepID=UPI0025C0298E|nr:hypothetical protein [Flavobacterium sp. BFFFF1]
MKKSDKLTTNTSKNITQKAPDTIVNSIIHNPNFIICDLDGDIKNDSVVIVQSLKTKKYGFKIVYGKGKTDFLGLGNEILEQGFDDIDWVGIFEKAPRGEKYANNVDENGDIIAENQIQEKDKIKLVNDGIFIHQAESCGGGVIYFDNGKYNWIQQE